MGPKGFQSGAYSKSGNIVERITRRQNGRNNILDRFGYMLTSSVLASTSFENHALVNAFVSQFGLSYITIIVINIITNT